MYWSAHFWRLRRDIRVAAVTLPPTEAVTSATISVLRMRLLRFPFSVSYAAPDARPCNNRIQQTLSSNCITVMLFVVVVVKPVKASQGQLRSLHYLWEVTCTQLTYFYLKEKNNHLDSLHCCQRKSHMTSPSVHKIHLHYTSTYISRKH